MTNSVSGSRRTTYSALLTALLILEFLYHNPMPWSDLPLNLWAYPMPFPLPFLVHVLPILGVVGWALWQRHRDADAPSVGQGVGYVEPVVRYAGLGLGVFVIGYGYAALAGFHSVLGEFWPAVLVWGGVAALVTWLLGLLFGLLGAALLAAERLLLR